MPLNDFPQTVPIKKIIRETPLVKTYVLSISLGAKPGQFVNVWLPGVDERPMSIGSDNGKEIELAIAAIGKMTKQLDKKKTGDYIGIRGPYGKSFQWKPRQHIAMIAGGYGAAPLSFAASLAIKQGCKIDFFLGSRTKSYLLYLNRIKKLKNVTLYISTDDGSAGFKGFNVQLFQKMLGEMPKKGAVGGAGSRKPFDTVMTCGPEIMMKKVSDLCAARKIHAQIDLERYMKCGFGICGNCCVDDLGIPVCCEGTIVNNSVAQQVTEFGKYHRDDLGRKHYF